MTTHFFRLSASKKFFIFSIYFPLSFFFINLRDFSLNRVNASLSSSQHRFRLFVIRYIWQFSSVLFWHNFVAKLIKWNDRDFSLLRDERTNNDGLMVVLFLARGATAFFFCSDRQLCTGFLGFFSLIFRFGTVCVIWVLLNASSPKLLFWNVFTNFLVVYELIIDSLVKASRTAPHNVHAKSRNSCYKTRVNLYHTVDFYRFLFFDLNANSRRSERSETLLFRLRNSSSQQRQQNKKIKFQIISLAMLHNMNGVYLFYGLFRAEPTGGPKISTRRKRRTGRASE